MRISNYSAKSRLQYVLTYTILLYDCNHNSFDIRLPSYVNDFNKGPIYHKQSEWGGTSGKCNTEWEYKR